MGVRMRQRVRATSASVLTLGLLLVGCSSGSPDGAPGAGQVAVAPDEALTPERIARELGDAVWKVEVDGCGVDGGGTAFAIAADLLVTNRHVVEFDPSPTLIDRSGGRRLEGTVIGMSEVVDLAVIRVEAVLGPILAWAPTASLAEGQPVVALGYPDPLGTFTVTPGTLNAFEVVDGVRVGIVSDEATDYGSSGGPLLTDRGRVAGIVTEFLGGTQNVGRSLSHDAVRAELAAIVADPRTLPVDCTGATYGTDDVLDALWGLCADGRMWACDELYIRSIGGSDYEWFGATCGELVDTDTWCTVQFDAVEAVTLGDDPDLDALWRACERGGSGWPGACDRLFRLAPEGSDYEAFGDSCGRRNEPAGWCEELHR